MSSGIIVNRRVGVIKIYSDVPDYNEGYKLVIDGGDIISLSGDTVTRFRQFESYEIRERSGSWCFVRKTDSTEGKGEALGLPKECRLPSWEDEGTPGKCEVNIDGEEKLRALNFLGKDGEGFYGLPRNANLKLTIIRVEDLYFPDGYRFIFSNDEDVIIPSFSENIILKKGTFTEFKINLGEGNDWTLERAWDLDSISRKLGLTAWRDYRENKMCCFGNTINVYVDEDCYVREANIMETCKNMRMMVEEDVEDHNQGFRLYAPEDIILVGGRGPEGGKIPTAIQKVGSNGSPGYEMKEIRGVWYLVRR